MTTEELEKLVEAQKGAAVGSLTGITGHSQSSCLQFVELFSGYMLLSLALSQKQAIEKMTAKDLECAAPNPHFTGKASI